MDQAPKTVRLSDEQFDSLKERIENSLLPSEDKKLIIQVFLAMKWLTRQLESKRINLGRLRRLLFGKKTESQKNIFGEGSEPPRPAPEAAETASEPEPQPKPKPKPPGHGRRGSDAYTGAEKVFCQHESLKPGDVCPECGKGKLHDSIDPGIFVQFKGSPLIEATVYETQKLRCGLCGKTFEAGLPHGVSAQKWDESAKTILSLGRYGYGLPFYRIERFQKDLGVPVSDSVSFEHGNQVADCLWPVYRLLIQKAALGKLLNYDDTTARILELMKENKTLGPDDRTGIFTTAVVSKLEEAEIALFFTGRKHAGENITELLKKRTPGLSPPILMADGSSMNPPKEFEALLANCLGHGRRNFVGLENQFPVEVKHVISTLGKVYHFDAVAKERAMTDDERLRFHQENSAPFMKELAKWCQDQMDNKKVEPNGPLGKAIKYMQKRWDKLTLFLRVPGAPLSNDIVERLIKTYVLHRKNSLFYKTQHGAIVGDILMTAIHTTVRNNQNPFEYLNAIQLHRHAAHKAPQAWLPWNYKTTLSGLSPPANA